MTDIPVDSGRSEVGALSQPAMVDLFAWLDSPPLLNAADELTPLLGHLQTLRDSQATPQQRVSALERLYSRGMSVTGTLLPSLSGIDLSIPIPRRTRQLTRSLQDLLRVLANDLFATLDAEDTQKYVELGQDQSLAFWRCLNVLAKHLAISSLVSSPAGSGIWRQLHQVYAKARHLGLAAFTPEGTASTLQTVYFSAVLLGCAQPSSFTTREIAFIIAYLDRSVDLIDSTTDTETPAKFWIDPSSDAAAMPCSRKTAPPDTQVFCFSCDRLAVQLRKQLALLESGGSPQQINLPEFSSTPAGRGVMRRLAIYWGNPGKRRFPRRRQNHRAALCSGLQGLWRLFQEGDVAAIETSNWMITNESPDGYALMHVSGKAGEITVGDIAGIRIGPEGTWQICIVRWALSENQEHMELGLQVLATRAVPALLALPAEIDTLGRLSVLILPKIQALHSSEMLVVPSGALENRPLKLVLVVEKGNLEIREMKSTHLDEQNSKIEVFSVEPDTLVS